MRTPKIPCLVLPVLALVVPALGADPDIAALSQRIDNFSEVSPGIYRGARPADAGLAALAGQGFKTDIDLQGGDTRDPIVGWAVPWLAPNETRPSLDHEKSIVESLGMSYYNEPLDAFSDVEADEWPLIRRALAIMSDPPSQPVFVHCLHGDDRTGLVIALYRVRYEGWPIKKAHHEMMEKGHERLTGIVTSFGLDRSFYQEAPRMLEEYRAENPGPLPAE